MLTRTEFQCFGELSHKYQKHVAYSTLITSDYRDQGVETKVLILNLSLKSGKVLEDPISGYYENSLRWTTAVIKMHNPPASEWFALDSCFLVSLRRLSDSPRPPIHIALRYYTASAERQ